MGDTVIVIRNVVTFRHADGGHVGAGAHVCTGDDAILDGTLIPIDRVADQEPYYSGKHKRPGVNVQVVADAAGRIV